MVRKDLYGEFINAIDDEETLYRNAICLQIQQDDNPYWPVLAKRIISELHTWLITNACSHRVQFDEARMKLLAQTIDYEFGYGVAISARFVPLPKGVFEWETYELFLASLIDQARRDRDLLKVEYAQLEHHWLVRVCLKHCRRHGFAWRWHRCGKDS